MGNNMNSNKFDLKKICAGVFGFCLVYGLIILLVSWNRIQTSALGIGTVYLFAALIAVLAVYLLHLLAADKKGKKSFGLYLIHTVERYQFLIEQLVTRDFKIKYKRSVLGVFWSFLNPLLMMVVQYMVFSNLMKFNTDHYAIYLLTGIVMFSSFNDCCNQALRAIIGNATLITKVYVPKYIYPITKVLSASINLVLSMVPLLLVTLVYGLTSETHLYLTWAVLLIPIALVLLVIFTIGMGFLLSSLMVFFHDVEFLWGVFSTMWMYATPIIYPISIFDGADNILSKIMLRVVHINPLYHYIEFMRSIIISGCSPALSEYLICAAWSFGMLALGAFVFKKTQDKFILYI